MTKQLNNLFNANPWRSNNSFATPWNRVSCLFIASVIHQTYLLNKIYFNQLLAINQQSICPCEALQCIKTTESCGTKYPSDYYSTIIELNPCLTLQSRYQIDRSLNASTFAKQKYKKNVRPSAITVRLCWKSFAAFFCVPHNIANSRKIHKLNLMKFKQHKKINSKNSKKHEMRANWEFNFSFFVKPINFARSDWALFMGFQSFSTAFPNFPLSRKFLEVLWI